MANETVFTPNDIVDRIRLFCDGDNWDRGYGFAHLVLGDWNLGHEYIRFCLEPRSIHDWTLQKIMDNFKRSVVRDDLEVWEREDYDAIIDERDAIVGFLRWLLSKDEEILDAAENILRQ